MGDEADAVLAQINAASAQGIDVDRVRRGINLVSFLRKPEATQSCLDQIAHWRTYVLFELLNPVVDTTDVRDEIEKCITVHNYFDTAGSEVKVIRRLNALKLKEAVQRLDPVERRARVFSFDTSLIASN